MLQGLLKRVTRDDKNNKGLPARKGYYPLYCQLLSLKHADFIEQRYADVLKITIRGQYVQISRES